MSLVVVLPSRPAWSYFRVMTTAHEGTGSRILVAGASGVLGRAFIPLAVAAGHHVTGAARSARRADTIQRLGAEPVIADALDRDALTRMMSDVKPAIVVDLLTDLASGNSATNARLRIEGTRNLVDAATGAGVERMIAESISWVYPPGDGVAHENDPLDLGAPEPRLSTINGVVALEAAVHELETGVVLRFGQLYGDGTWYARDGALADAARAGKLQATETVTSFIHVDDAARAISAALDWPAGTWNIVDDEPAAGTEWAPVFADRVGAPAPEATTSGDVGRPVSNARARARGLDLRRPSWRAGFSSL
ncbi:NAD(P)-dependent oxidoreductase [Curtobacterium sp. 314Chir4.1]|uniref:NAD-dependent epimerase/dehydratase family protein n=1 Tax=Curtobacterium sp. 314Chir4.1 TaxID=1279028 RepID=UPI001C3EDCDD|nr:NAD-dependent epimerase/dehydratase family protein [Curtobacterium sp. 314Chir4.1]